MKRTTITLYDAFGERCWTVPGYEVPIEGTTLVLHRTPKEPMKPDTPVRYVKGWTLGEPTSGSKIFRADTQEECIEGAKRRIADHGGMPGLHAAIERILERRKEQQAEPA